ncbi:MAG: YbaB/EbfC family nucleoid-associated protein [Treponema sp.]|nr:YbaB/EbfC family nucleoid-associated protein [Treponema sp.]
MNPFELLKNAGAIQQQVKQLQEEMGTITATGSAGGNMVNVTVNGKMEIVGIHLDPIAVDNRDIPMLQDLIIAAHHDAMEKVQEAMKEKLGPLVSGMPGLNI